MSNDRYTERVKDVMSYSREEANRLNNNHVAPEHLLLGVLREGTGIAISTLKIFSVDLRSLKKTLEDGVRESTQKTLATDRQDVMPLLTATRNVLNLFELEARRLKVYREVADTEHLVLAILKEDKNMAATVLKSLGVTYDKYNEEVIRQYSIQNLNDGADISFDGMTSNSSGSSEYENLDKTNQQIENINKNDSIKDNEIHISINLNDNVSDDMNDIDDDDDDDDAEDPFKGATPERDRSFVNNNTNNNNNRQQKMLERFTIDYIKMARENQINPLIGRDKEVERLVQTLSRKRKNNVVIIGQSGVGKTAIVEGLALRIINRQVSPSLYNKRIIGLDVNSLLAGTKYRGQFEERMQSFINYFENNKDAILFVDEIHTLLGAGDAVGGMDAAAILKPALSRGKLQCIGTTTSEEYRKYFEKDGAFCRRFQKLTIEPNTEEETLKILNQIKREFEEHHLVEYTEDALKACVKLSGRYISDRQFPDKAIDVMDEAGARVKVRSLVVNDDIAELEKKISELEVKKVQAVQMQNFELAITFREDISKLKNKLENVRRKWMDNLQKERRKVTDEDVQIAVSTLTGIPIQRLAKDEIEKLMDMPKTLCSRVIGQDAAVEKIVKCIRRSRMGLSDPNKPIGSFLFLGSTGVGKTYLAKCLALEMFGSEDALIRIDMSEFMEKFSVSRLIGATPGYVGYEEGGQLTEKVFAHPYSIVLFDEIEKAHQDVYNIFLQVLDEGHLTDGQGRKVDFRNTILIMTSNVGSRKLKDFGHRIGFTGGNIAEDKTASEEVIKKELNKTFSPEFLNRIDEIVNFAPLDKDSISKIVSLELDKVRKRMSVNGINLEVTDKAVDLLIKKGYDPAYGARPMRRAIQSNVEDVVSDLMIDVRDITNGDTVVVDVTEDEKETKASVRRKTPQLEDSSSESSDTDTKEENVSESTTGDENAIKEEKLETI